MARELWTADGYLLTNNRVRDVGIDSSIYNAPGKRGENAELYGQHGASWRPKYFTQGSVVINTWSNASPPPGHSRSSQQAAQDEYRRALSVLTKQYGLIEFRRYWDDGSRSYRNWGEMVQSVEPVYVHPGHFRWGYEIVFPNPFWVADTEYTHDSGVGTTPRTVTLTNHADATAPMEDFRFEITGPIVNPTVTLITPSVTPAPYFKYNGTLASGDVLTVNSETYTVSGANANPTFLEYNQSRFMVIHPGTINPANDTRATPVVRLTGSSSGATTRLRVFGKSKVLI